MTVLTRWSLFNYLEEMDLALTPFGIPFRARPPLAVTYPPVNIWEEEGFLYAEAELPGMKLEDLEIFVMDEQLAIAGTRLPLPLESVTWHSQERALGAFNRVLPLPVPVIPQKVEAHLVNGVLTIKMAMRPVAEPKKIAVEAG
jgi:HSP20 family protein